MRGGRTGRTGTGGKVELEEEEEEVRLEVAGTSWEQAGWLVLGLLGAETAEER